MQRRLLAVFFVALVAVVGVVLWNALRSERAPAVGDAQAGARSTTAARASDARDTPAVVAPPVEKSAPQVEMAAPTVEEASLLDQRELAAQGALEFTVDVTWPDAVPADERAFLVVQGKSLTDVISRVPLTGAGRQTLYLPKEHTKGRIALEARYLYLEESLRLDPAKHAKPLACAPKVGAWLHGRVLFPERALAEDRDVSNVRITRASSALDGGGETRSGDADFSRVAADGSYSFGGLQPTMRHWISLDLPAFVRLQHSLESVVAGETYEHDFELALGARFSGRVVDEAGKPIAAARVECVTRQSWGRYPVGRHAITSTDGTFELRGIEPKKLELHVTAKGYVDHLSAPIDALEADVRSDLAIVLARGNALAGIVRWADGKPADGAAIRITDLTATGEVKTFGPNDDAPDAKCDAEGKFDVSGLGAGPFDVVASATQVIRTEGKKRERKPWRATLSSVDANRRDLVFVLAPPIAVVGKVVDDLGAPITKFEVQAQPEDKDLDFDFSGRVTQVFKDEHGTFRMEKLHPGTWRLSVEAQGYEESADETVRLADGEVQVSFVCNRGATLSGRVLDPHGAPIAGAEIEARPVTDRATWSSSDCATDSDGEFECKGQSAGRLSVFATHSAWAASLPEELELAPGDALAGLTLHLRVGGRVEVTVLTPPGVEKADTRVNLYTIERGYNHIASQTTDAAGIAKFEHVAPGEYQVQSWRNDDAGGGGERGKVTVVEGRTSSIVLGRADALAIRVSGTVRAGTRPLEGVRVNFWKNDAGHTSGQRWSETGADGKYEVTLDQAGAWQMHASRRSASRSQQVEIPAQSTFVHDVTFGTATVSGRVFDTRGEPVAEVAVDLRTGAGTVVGTFGGRVATDASGRFEYEFLAPGTYTVATDDASSVVPGCADARSAPFDLAEGQELDGIDLVLSAGGKVEVRLRGAGRDEWRMVQLFDADAHSLGFQRVAPGADVAVFDGVEPGRCFASANCDSALSSPAEVDVVVGALRTVEVELVAAAKLTVRLVDASGKPVEGWVAPGDPSALVPGKDAPAKMEHVFEHLHPGSQTYGAKTASGATGSILVELAAGESKSVELVVGS
ncbi:MAG: carboxypeptidase-like regulatory domain-containing protein [Planctomycetes bacterium]|nr:carboxypeptidase-like regulatory domain-containing protein [Planctomycetota bacterium]